mmetsp:Transcript_11797/g.30107  ORF Transcript_11797/g.30107 Transcript_11797/m.30107 type:complete len:219 (-) Transcript_11797:15-671(-)
MAAVQAWHSQLGQDAWVCGVLGHKRGGFFVELGAGDGVDLSNTLALERHLDWGGICIEPSPQFQMLRRNRRCVCDPSCVGGGDGDVVTFLVDHKYGQHNHFSGIKELINCHQPQGLEYQMRTKTLASVLQQHNAPRVMDYLSLDTEGSELAILSSFPFDSFTFLCMTVEHNFQHAHRQGIRDVLTANGYVLAEERQWDDFYVHTSVSGLLQQQKCCSS